MSLIKAKDAKDMVAPCGAPMKVYPIGPDQDLCSWSVFWPTQAEVEDEKWHSQSHMHPDKTEYWFVLEGKGQITVGDETYDVEPGDLVITPPLKPHSFRGGITVLCTMAKYNKDGKTYGNKVPMVWTDPPYGDEPEKQPKQWEYMELECG